MQDYVNKNWEQVLKSNALDSFESCWNVSKNWVEPPNHRRRGWSGVAKITLDNGKTIYLKRQSNHFCKTWFAPIKGIPTFAREARNLLRFQAELPTQTLVYYAQRAKNAIIITENLEHFVSLQDFLSQKISPQFKRILIKQLAKFVWEMHQQKIQHTALYPKHIFLKIVAEEQVEFRLIDLETAKRKLSVRGCRFRDLDTLNRHTDISIRDKIRFLSEYLTIPLKSPQLRQWVTRLKRRAVQKGN